MRASTDRIDPLLFGHNAVWCRDGLGLQRPDAIVAARELRPGILRFPGGTRAMCWHFDQTIGSERTPQLDPFRGVRDATRYGIDEGLDVAEQLGAEVTLVAPWVEGSPQETAALVAYVSGKHDVAIGVDARGRDWGRARDWIERRGRPARPVRFLEIGNEPYLGLRIGPTDFRQCEQFGVPTTARLYAEAVVETSRLVRAIDPDVKIGACAIGGLFDHEDPETAIGAADDELGTHDPWNPRLLGLAGHAFDHWILHPYVVEPTDARLHLGERIRRNVRALRNLDPLRPIAITEHGFLLGGDTMMNALVSIDVLRVAIEERLLMALRHLLIEDDPSGPFANAAAILGPELTRTPAWHATKLATALIGLHHVESEQGVVRSIVTREGASLLYRLDRGEPIEVPARGRCTLLRAESLESRSCSIEEIEATGSVRLPAASLLATPLPH
jgi:hypothetical protein